MRLDSHWGTADLVLRGEFCPLSEIDRLLDNLRIASGASAALLLVADQKAVLRTLCACVPGNVELVSDAQALLATASFLASYSLRERRLKALQDYARATERDATRWQHRFPATAEAVLGALAEAAARQDRYQLSRWFEEADNWMPVAVPEQARVARLAPAILLRDSTASPQLADGRQAIVMNEASMKLTEAINGTVHSSLRVDELMVKRLDERLKPTESAGDDFLAAIRGLVRVAAEVVEAELAAVYLINPARSGFERQAVSNLSRATRENWEYPRSFPLRSDRAGTKATEAHQTVQLEGRARLGSEGPGSCDCRTADAAFRELATPLPGPLASAAAPAIGFLSITRVHEAGRAFGAHEVAVIRNAALRLSLLANSRTTAEAAQTFLSLSRTKRTPSRSSDRGQLDRSLSDVPVVPDDIWLASSSIQQAIQAIGSVTRCESATFRAALPDASVNAIQGVSLVCVAAYPHGVPTDRESQYQTNEQGGVNWAAVESGELINIPDISRLRKGAYLARRPQTRAELCVPVTAERRVVGVINLESPRRHAFDGYVDTTQAIAEHVGLAIANTRLSLASVLQEHAIDVIRRAHDLTHKPQELRDIADVVGSEEATKLRGFADGLEAETDELRFPPESGRFASALADTRLPSLVAWTVRHLELSYVETREPNPLEWKRHEPAAAEAILKALLDLMRNAREHRKRGRVPVKLTLLHSPWAGALEEVLEVSTKTDVVLEPEMAVNVYRCPLPFGGSGTLGDVVEPRLGAYVAGLYIRQIGGDLHLRFPGDDEVRAVLSVPAAGATITGAPVPGDEVSARGLG